MVLKVFTQPNCPKCPAAKALCAQISKQQPKLKIEQYDVSTPEGLAEASFYAVLSTPSLILVDDNGKEVRSWRGEVPSLKEISGKLF
jgi:thiol-disulfide isomerase/thioredoxin